MNFSVYRAPRSALVEDLRQSAADRTSHGKLERAAAAEAAAAQLEAGAEVAYFERTYYEPAESRSRHAVIRRTREDLVAELHDASEGWAHQDKMTLAFDARKAAGEVLEGADSVDVGHLRYEVIGA
jgi:hypothetical protein